ncbi:MAG: hypothetical protein HQ445_05485 [Polaromonas sp.]|nr:hypothetical protein [Polaromonas sp.]
MNTALHPVMQQALAPLLMPASAPKRSYKAPSADGLIEFEWSTDCAEKIVCHLEHHAAERGSREVGTGLQLERDYPEQLELISAYLFDVDIFYLLRPEQMAEIETLALRELQS